MIDALILLGPRDHDLVEICALSVREFVNDVRTIWIVSQRDPKIPGTVFVDEKLLPFSLEDVGNILGVTERAGWYFQQLIKLYAPTVIPSILQQYLVVDADTFFLQPCRFVEDGRPIFNLGTEFHAPYFEHMHRLHPSLVKSIIYSGITHTLAYDCRWLREMFNLIEGHHDGKPFWRIFLDEVDPLHKENSGASEHELYFTFCILNHINEVIIKALKWANISSINEIDHSYYYASLHWYLRDVKIDTEALKNKIFRVC